jgi:hypothetical protein
MDIEQSPTYVALPEHAKPAWLRAIRALPPAWLIAPATGEVFEGKEDCHQRLQGWGLFEGFGVVQGRVWKDGTPRWEFKCKLHGTETLNTRGLEPRKLKDKEGKVVTDRQRNTKKIWRKKKTHGKANAPGLTAAQSSDRDRVEAERIANKGKTRAATPEKEVERVPDSPERPSTPLSRKRTNTLVERTPGKLTPARAPPALQSAPEPSQLAPPPPSTAPAILYKGKGGRERKRTNKAAESKAAGWLAESQPREWASNVIGLELFRAKPYLEIFGVGASEVNVYIRGSL